MFKYIPTLLLISVAFAAEGRFGVEEDENVAVLGDSTFNDFVKNNQFVFVKFYAPWCGHCKSMAPAYASLAKKVHEEEGMNVVIAKVDATVHKEVATAHGVQGFPTLKFFINGTPVDYQGAREENDIYNWLQKKTGPASKLLETDEDYEKHSTQKLSVLFHLPQDSTDQLNVYQALAAGYDDILFAHSHSEKHAENLELTKKYTMVVFRTFDEGHKFLTNDEPFTADQLKTFLENHRYPFVTDFDQDAANRIFGQQKTAFILMTDKTESEQITTFREFAKNNQGEIVFSLSAITSGFGARLAEYVGVKAENDPTIRVVSFTGGNLNKFIINDLTTEGLTSGLNQYKEGKLEAHFKSAPIPEKNDEAVKVVVGDSFEQMVTTEDKYVLLEAYAPWCGHCKKLEPIYKELAESLATETDIVIAKMDATENEHNLMPVQGFPTLRLFKPGSRTPVDYNGDRSLKDLTHFLETQLGRTFEGLKSEDL